MGGHREHLGFRTNFEMQVEPSARGPRFGHNSYLKRLFQHLRVVPVALARFVHSDENNQFCARPGV